ncbi:MAG: response regulator [Acidobacteria bacterium]|nr:MAG: response regulator [Acidobacteriota bacterium]REK07757.1 MAG: response regulator [Acidobacteriota bacterium]
MTTSTASTLPIDLWRRRALDGLSWMVVAVATLPVLMVSRDYERVGSLPMTATLLILFAVTVAIAAGRAAPYRVRAWGLLAVVVAATQLAIASAGFNSGVGALFALSAGLAALLLGWRSAVVVLLFQGVGCLVVAWLYRTAQLPPPPQVFASGDDPGTWLRKYAVVTSLSLVVAATISYLLDRLQKSVDTAETLIDELRDQIAARQVEAEARAAAEGQLWQAQKHELVGQLAAGLAHDINNTLTVILANVELMRLDLEEQGFAGGSDLQRYASEVETAALTASTETRRLLGLGRREPLQLRLLDPAEELEDVARRLAPLLPENVLLELEVERDLPPFEADRDQLRQVLLNLAVNARDAMPEGGRLSLVSRRIAAKEGRRAIDGSEMLGEMICLEVRDTGSGIPADLQERIFEPFFTSKSESRGSGLGLSLVRSFVQRAGATLELDSTPGAGSTFRIVLRPGRPATSAAAHVDTSGSRRGGKGQEATRKGAVGGVGSSDGAAAEEDSATMPPRRDDGALPVGPAATEPGLGERILVVDDDERIRSLIVQVLRRAGYEVVEAASGEEALAILDRGNRAFDLLCTDAVMPGMSGEELARQYAQRYPGGRVLVCSGYVRSASLRRLLGRRHYGFLAKPFTPGELVEAVRRKLQQPTPVRVAAGPS